MRAPFASRRQHQSGFTLVEIMVALTISLLLMAGVTQIFLGNRESYQLQSGMSTLQENARFAMDILRRDLMMAGYPATVTNYITGADGGSNASDSVTIQFQSATDCVGSAVGGAGITRHVYHVGDADAAGVIDGISSLYCTPNGGTATALVDGIDNMQLLYGDDLDKDGYPDRYVAASNAIVRIVTVRLALLINSIEPVARTTDASTYALLNAPLTAEFADRRARRVFFSTVIIRNQFGKHL